MPLDGPPRLPPALPGSGPVALRDRIGSLDVMRGVALCGILVINIQGFALLMANYEHAVFNGAAAGINYWVWLPGYLFLQGKAITIFSMLFGAGVVLSTRRRDEGQLPVAAYFYRRYAILAGIGILHSYFLWFGDILFTYAICAFAVILLRRVNIKLQALLGILCQLVFPGLLAFASLGLFDPEFREMMQAEWAPSPEQVEAEIGAFRGSWASWFLANGAVALEIQLWGMPTMLFWRCAGHMLLGMALLRSGFFEFRWKASSYRRGACLGILTGLGLAATSVAIREGTRWSLEFSLLGGIPNELGSTFLAFGYICAGVLLVESGRSTFLTRTLASLGRVALSAYLLQSVICALLFHGWGLGYFQQLERVQMLGVVVAILVVEAVLATAWLSRFRFGPMEWLWRRLSYGKIPAAAPGPGGSG